MDKHVKWTIIIFVLIGAFFFDNIRGYYRFKALCEAHQELDVYQKLDTNVGWQTPLEAPKNISFATTYLYFMPQIKFFRLQRFSDRKIYDVEFSGSNRVAYELFDRYARSSLEGEKNDINNYSILPINQSVDPVYELERFSEELPNETRMSQSGYKVRDLRTNQVAVKISSIGYSLFNKEHTFLSAPSGKICRFAPSIFSEEVQLSIFKK